MEFKISSQPVEKFWELAKEKPARSYFLNFLTHLQYFNMYFENLRRII